MRVGRPKKVKGGLAPCLRYTLKQLSFLRKEYKQWPAKVVTAHFNKQFKMQKTVFAIYATLKRYKMHCPRTGRYPPGLKPWNAGTKGMRLTTANRTSFKKGCIPSNRKPLGATHIDKDGYIMIKIPERNPHFGWPTRFQFKHIIEWQRWHGRPVPRGRVVMFKDCNRGNFRKSNLVLMPRSLHVRLNQLQYAKQPKELRRSVFLLAQLRDRLGQLKRKKKPPTHKRKEP